jgi:hypothetical protein
LFKKISSFDFLRGLGASAVRYTEAEDPIKRARPFLRRARAPVTEGNYRL